MIDLDILGREGIAEVARAVRRLGSDRVIVNEMTKEIRRSVGPIRDAVKANELEVLPHRGGLGAWVAKGRVSAAVRRAAASAGVKIVQGRKSEGGRSDLKRLDGGAIRHPSWGNRKAWSPQSVPAGAFTNAVAGEGVDAFRLAVVDAVNTAVEKVL